MEIMNYLEIENEMAKTYNAIANKYEKEAKEDWKDKEYVNKFLMYLEHKSSVLDIACGTGELLKYYNDIGLKTTGIDISKAMVNISKNKVPNANIMNMSLYNLDKLEEKFDGISITFTLVHIPKEKINEVIGKINEKLKDNGKIFIVFTTSIKAGLQAEPLDNNYKYYAINYSIDEVCNILENSGFEILESKEKRINKQNVGIIIAKKEG